HGAHLGRVIPLPVSVGIPDDHAPGDRPFIDADVGDNTLGGRGRREDGEGGRGEEQISSVHGPDSSLRMTVHIASLVPNSKVHTGQRLTFFGANLGVRASVRGGAQRSTGALGAIRNGALV